LVVQTIDEAKFMKALVLHCGPLSSAGKLRLARCFFVRRTNIS